MFSRLKRSSLFSLFLLGLFVITNLFGVFLLATPAQAQVGAVVDKPALIQREQLHDREKAEVVVDKGFYAAAVGSLIQAASYFTRRLAFDTAMYVANGGKGQSGLAFKDGFGSYLEKEIGNSVGTAIGEFGKTLGLNLCQVPDARLQLFLQLGFRTLYGKDGPQPTCTWQSLVKGGIFDNEAWQERYGDKSKLAETFSTSIQVSQTDFGIALGAMAQLDRITAQEKESKTAERLEGSGFKPLTDLISGNVKTPADVIREETTAITSKHQGELSLQQIQGIYGSGAAQIFPSAASVFLNTFTSQLLQQLLGKGLLQDGGTSEDIANLFSGPGSSREQAQRVFSRLFTETPTKQISDFQLVETYSTCPSNPGQNNCVIDTGLQRALIEANSKPMTIREALDKGYLHGDWQLVSPRRRVDNESVDKCRTKYCYSNIQKLRKVRILPLGFEIAALRSDPDQPWTLEQVVDGFYTCKRAENGKVIPDPAFPFCNLINPNWIVRAPIARCETEINSAQIDLASGADRKRECADISTCIDEKEDGSCGGNFGYCTKEKNIWRLGGLCPNYYATCSTYTNTDTNESASYLSKTVDYGSCNADSVGCLTYSTEKTGENWIRSTQVDGDLKFVGRNQTMYFNKNIKSASNVCNANSEGCTGFVTAKRNTVTGLYDKNGQNYVQDTQSQLLYLKKAPDYMGCYDADPNTLEVEAPATLVQVNTISAKTSCEKFAPVCLPEEVGCESYKPKQGPAIPGVIGNNSCNTECVGYETYKQEATDFEQAKFPLAFIAKNGKQCEPRFAGCDEFTNLDVSSGGGEKKEYYTKIKYCEKPAADASNIKTYYSWEGSIQKGFVLKVHRLKPIDQVEAQYIAGLGEARFAKLFDVGSPALADDGKESVTLNADQCNEQIYRGLVNNIRDERRKEFDCRALYDDAGTIYYRLISNTVTVSAACHPLRKTTSEFYVDESLSGNANGCTAKGGVYNAGECKRCVNGGRYENNACVYQTISRVGEATSCTPAANGCRAYTGSGANNTHTIFEDDFEANTEDAASMQNALRNWEPKNSLRISVEATHVGQHSLQIVTNEASRTLAASDIRDLSSYRLSFWSRGASGNLKIEIVQGDKVWPLTFDAVNNVQRPVAVTDVWQSYTVGPANISGYDSSAPAKIRFTKDGGNYFIDHVQLLEVRDTVFLIKNSWKTPEGYDVPLSCDATPNDARPGAALNCQEFVEESTNKVRRATGFERLCRAKAVGCQPVWNTNNTVLGDSAKLTQVYNAWCAKRGEEDLCRITLDGVELGSCTAERAKLGCFIKKIVIPAGKKVEDLPDDVISPSTVIVTGDTPVDKPLFIANQKEYRCSEQERGCVRIALEQKTIPSENASAFKFVDVYAKNDPEIYDKTLCRNDLVGCGEFVSGKTKTYFKDPKVTGNSLCYYKPQDASHPDAPFGWLKQDVGKCIGGPNNNQLCRDVNDCGGPGPNGNVQCGKVGQVACYENYQRAGGENDIWANSTPNNYRGFVGKCEPQYNQCVELIDPIDKTTAYPKGTPYYVIYDDRIQDKIKQCNGKVSQNEGCVLFNRTDIPNKLYDAQASYDASQKQNYQAVSAVTQGNLDTNVLLKVDRDRQCSQWLSCATTVRHYDPVQNKTIDLCYQYRACEKMQGGECVKWVDDFENSVSKDEASQKLNYETYVGRGTSWYDQEYTGYSLYNTYRVHDMTYVRLDFEKLKSRNILNDADLLNYGGKTFLAYKQDARYFSAGSGFENKGCRQKQDWDACGLYDNNGRCFSKECVYPINDVGFPVDAVGNTRSGMLKILASLDGSMCKSYPEKDSPFSREVVAEGGFREVKNGNQTRIVIQEKKAGYNGANVCQDAADCSCEYKKITYKNGTTDYWSFDTNLNQLPKGICDGGKKVIGQNEVDMEGATCVKDNECGDPGTQGKCNPVTAKQSSIGFQGYCLEYDYSRPLGYGSTPYPCLTWLPIGVSASGADNFNSFLEAGYNPDGGTEGDAPLGGGKLYCTDASLINGTPYDDTKFDGEGLQGKNVMAVDQNLMEGDRERLEDDLYRKYFSGLFPKSVPDVCVGGNQGQGAQQQCNVKTTVNCNDNDNIDSGILGVVAPDQLNDYPYEQAVCAKNVKPLYTAVQWWMRNNIENVFSNGGGKESAIVLRLEYGVPAAGGFGRWGQSGAAGSPIIYSFAPARGDHAAENHILEFGTVMHPPRSLPNGSSALARTQRGITVESSAFSAEAPRSGGISQLVYVSPFERELYEGDIKKIQFMPLSYPNGLESEAPALFAPQLYIDFDELKSRPTGAMARGVLAANPRKRDAENETQFPTNLDASDSVALTYKISGDRISQYSHTTYDSFTDERVRDEGKKSENQISTRYVLVFGDWYKDDGQENQDDTVLSVLRDTIPVDGNYNIIENDTQKILPPSPQQDPFDNSKVPCVFSGEDQTSWFAIGLDFNAKGKFLGYISRWCNNENPSDDVGIQFAVGAVINRQCTEFSQVYNERNPLREITNRAWTNRVWSGAQTSDGIALKHPSEPYKYLLNLGTLNQPYGSLLLESADINDKETLRNTNIKSDTVGFPYSCTSNWLDAPLIEQLSDCTYILAPNAFQQPRIFLERERAENGRKALLELFAQIFNVGQFKFNLQHEGENLGNIGVTFKGPAVDQIEGTFTSSMTGDDNNKLPVASRPKPPQIYSLNPVRCSNPSREHPCTAGEKDNVTIGGKNGTLNSYDGNQIPDEDQNNDGAPDAIIGNQMYLAEMRFFAFADDNRMPLRDVKIDWQDGSTIYSQRGLYKNRKPVCEAANGGGKATVGICVAGGVPTNVTCSELSACPNGETCVPAETLGVIQDFNDEYATKRFGNLPRACTPGYFEFAHPYTCNASDVANGADPAKPYVKQISSLDPKLQTQILQRSANLNPSDFVCVFKPRVQVTDNWGWCNGSCPQWRNKGGGCYNEGQRSFCSEFGDINVETPNYTEYKGTIVVIPNKPGQ